MTVEEAIERLDVLALERRRDFDLLVPDGRGDAGQRETLRRIHEEAHLLALGAKALRHLLGARLVRGDGSVGVTVPRAFRDSGELADFLDAVQRSG